MNCDIAHVCSTAQRSTAQRSTAQPTLNSRMESKFCDLNSHHCGRVAGKKGEQMGHRGQCK